MRVRETHQAPLKGEGEYYWYHGLANGSRTAQVHMPGDRELNSKTHESVRRSDSWDGINTLKTVGGMRF